MPLTLGNSRRGVRLGDEELSPDDLSHHIHMLGSTGVGKSEQAFDILKDLTPMPGPKVLFDCKGPLAERYLEWCVSSGYASKVNYLKLGDPKLSWAQHASAQWSGNFPPDGKPAGRFFAGVTKQRLFPDHAEISHVAYGALYSTCR